MRIPYVVVSRDHARGNPDNVCLLDRFTFVRDDVGVLREPWTPIRRCGNTTPCHCEAVSAAVAIQATCVLLDRFTFVRDDVGVLREPWTQSS